jgi:hypothetical protein
MIGQRLVIELRMAACQEPDEFAPWDQETLTSSIVFNVNMAPIPLRDLAELDDQEDMELE